MFILKFRKNNVIKKYVIAISLFLLIVIPIAYIRIQTTGNDGLISHVSAGSGYYQHISESGENGQKDLFNLLGVGVTNFCKYFAWSMIPTKNVITYVNGASIGTVTHSLSGLLNSVNPLLSYLLSASNTNNGDVLFIIFEAAM